MATPEDYCLVGQLIHCSDLKGMGSNFPGFFAEYAAGRNNLVFSVHGIGPDTAVFTEPAGCAMHGLESLQMRPGERHWWSVRAPPGSCSHSSSRARGAASVTVAAPSQFKLDTAAALGVDQTILIDRSNMEANRQALLQASERDGFDYVVEATGSTSVGEICVPLTRNGATVRCTRSSSSCERGPQAGTGRSARRRPPTQATWLDHHRNRRTT